MSRYLASYIFLALMLLGVTAPCSSAWSDDVITGPGYRVLFQENDPLLVIEPEGVSLYLGSSPEMYSTGHSNMMDFFAREREGMAILAKWGEETVQKCGIDLSDLRWLLTDGDMRTSCLENFHSDMRRHFAAFKLAFIAGLSSEAFRMQFLPEYRYQMISRQYLELAASAEGARHEADLVMLYRNIAKLVASSPYKKDPDSIAGFSMQDPVEQIRLQFMLEAMQSFIADAHKSENRFKSMMMCQSGKPG